MKHTKNYMDAMWVIENPEKYDNRDVIRAYSFIEAYNEGYNKALSLGAVSTRYSYYEIEQILMSQIDHMIQCVQDSQGTIDPSEDINDIEITLKVLKHVYNVC